MVTITVTIKNKLGLHARASAKLVATAAKFHSALTIIKDNQAINGKSIMGVMMLAATTGTQLKMEIDGPDENEMADTLSQLILNKFGESE